MPLTNAVCLYYFAHIQPKYLQVSLGVYETEKRVWLYRALGLKDLDPIEIKFAVKDPERRFYLNDAEIPVTPLLKFSGNISATRRPFVE